MQFTKEERGDITIIFAEGNLVLERTSDVYAFVENIIENPDCKGIIFDCHRVHYVDSSGLGIIVSIYKTLKAHDKKFAISRINDSINDLLTLTKLDEILFIASDLDAAIGSFQ